MTNCFLEEIKKYQQNYITLYNSTGNTDAYKIMVRHISYAQNLNIGTIYQNVLKVSKPFMLVDFEKETVSVIKPGSQIEVIKLEEVYQPE